MISSAASANGLISFRRRKADLKGATANTGNARVSRSIRRMAPAHGLSEDASCGRSGLLPYGTLDDRESLVFAFAARYDLEHAVGQRALQLQCLFSRRSHPALNSSADVRMAGMAFE